MPDSDDEYQGDDASDDEFGSSRAASGTPLETRGRSRPDGGKKGGRKGGKAAWEDIQRSWDAVVEGADGTLAEAIEGIAEAEKRARLLRDTTPLQRGIIRHLVLVLDMSFAMLEKDLLPTRYELVMAYAREFVREYFEQNPISQLAIIGMRDGVAVRISDMSGDPADHLEKLQGWVKQEPQGNPSLQNALEMCRGALFHTPSHGTREVLIVYGALMSSDPGDIRETMVALINDRIRVSIVGLAAQVAICDELCAKTNGGESSGYYSIALHEHHLRDLLLATTTPPVTRAREQSNASLLMMGFPSRTLAAGDAINYCACHNRPTREGYACTRCGSRVCRLPSECPGCGLTLILSTHLARSYHHLFPLRNWVEVSWTEARKSKACYACLAPFPEVPSSRGKGGKDKTRGKEKENGKPVAPAPLPVKGLSESGRYACEVCRNHFCIDCDLFAHEVLHNCPGCQSDTRGALAAQNGETNGGAQVEAQARTNGAMEVDS
ncbi:hypothetical protein DL766_003428 [Monosporascus sp. MC13-8B]|uniref:General transcription and DNA repair factor IIH n=1 Tax=Monosporascus cannonballus TaxID=155416 RepID=A0ABY0HGP8_9PEZI|nr:hypothetical protein DL763_006666 [Monosporascus cannonballus]RYO92746.1 hypothetical protein DL762_001452 [Monosporascus cannonballus]RYP33508.1 hypothetical protein DL766_003428 [Monosporascus sp. MC13-8B]